MSGTNSGKLAPLQHQAAPLRNKIITALRSAIETGLLQPGARLIERDLCEQLNVSRTSLREALRELQADGILSHTETRGLAVSVLPLEEAENAYRIRAVLEALIVEQFIERADEAERTRLTADGQLLKKAYLSGSVDRILASKRAFYDRICSGAQNSLAFDILTRIVLRTSTLRSRSLARKERQLQSVKEIDAILDAIQARDIPAAKRAATIHVESAAKSALMAADVPAEAAKAPAGRKKKAATA
jgi:DNA-binding GntR family transcriptional regulator